MKLHFKSICFGANAEIAVLSIVSKAEGSYLRVLLADRSPTEVRGGGSEAGGGGGTGGGEIRGEETFTLRHKMLQEYALLFFNFSSNKNLMKKLLGVWKVSVESVFYFESSFFLFPLSSGRG